MPRVIHFSYDSLRNPWIGGGGAIRLHEIYRRLATQYEITVLAAKYPGARDQVVDGVRYVYAGWAPNYTLSRISYSLIVLAISLLGFLTLRKPELIAVDFDPFTFYLPFFNRRKTILNIHHLYGREPLRKYGLPGYLAYWFERCVPGLYRKVVFVSESVRRRLELPAARSTIIYNGIESDLFAQVPEEGDYLLALGRIDIYNKGLDVLLPAYRQLRALHPKLRLLIAGDGKDMPQLRQMVAEQKLEEVVELAGRVDAPRKRDLLRRCLLVVMPSRYEGWGIVAIEAAACGKAVVGTDIDGLRDSIVQGQTGLLCEKGNSDDLCAKLNALVEDPKLRQQLGAQGRARARRFMWDGIAREQDQFFVGVLNGTDKSAPSRQ